MQKACIEVAISNLKELNSDIHHEIVCSMLLELQMAASLCKAFNEVWSSIYWMNARKKTKDRVTVTLRDMSKKIIDHIEETMRLFDELCEEQKVLPTIPLTHQWVAFQSSLSGIRGDFYYHDEFVKATSIEGLPLFQYLERKQGKQKVDYSRPWPINLREEEKRKYKN